MTGIHIRNGCMEAQVPANKIRRIAKGVLMEEKYLGGHLLKLTNLIKSS
jgi:hypothetical protein